MKKDEVLGKMYIGTLIIEPLNLKKDKTMQRIIILAALAFS